MNIYSHMHLHGYGNAVAFRHMFPGIEGEGPMVFFACNWHNSISQSLQSRGGQECVGRHRVWLPNAFTYTEMSFEAMTF